VFLVLCGKFKKEYEVVVASSGIMFIPNVATSRSSGSKVGRMGKTQQIDLVNIFLP
jgi:hypothetical protein